MNYWEVTPISNTNMEADQTVLSTENAKACDVSLPVNTKNTSVYYFVAAGSIIIFLCSIH
jgi:hypothetical protein